MRPLRGFFWLVSVQVQGRFFVGWVSHTPTTHVYERGPGTKTYLVMYSRPSIYFTTWTSVSGSNSGIWAFRAKNRATMASSMRKTYSIATWTGISFAIAMTATRLK